MGGNLALCRIYSLLLALQIKACEEGLYVNPSSDEVRNHTVEAE